MKLQIHLILVLILLNGCATRLENKALDQKISTEPPVSSRNELRAEAQNTIDNAVNLSPDQKAKLTELRQSVTSQTDEFNRQSLELRSVLLKDLLSNTNYNRKEVGLIKNRMRKLEERRLSMIFDSIDKANFILGREAAANRRVMQEFIGDHESYY